MAEQGQQPMALMTPEELQGIIAYATEQGKNAASYEMTGLHVPKGVEPWRALPMWGTLGQGVDLWAKYIREQRESPGFSDELHGMYFDEPVRDRIFKMSPQWSWMDAFYWTVVPWTMAEEFYFAGRDASEKYSAETDALASEAALIKEGFLVVDGKIKPIREAKPSRARRLAKLFKESGMPAEALKHALEAEDTPDEELGGILGAYKALQDAAKAPGSQEYILRTPWGDMKQTVPPGGAPMAWPSVYSQGAPGQAGAGAGAAQYRQPPAGAPRADEALDEALSGLVGDVGNLSRVVDGLGQYIEQEVRGLKQEVRVLGTATALQRYTADNTGVSS